MFEFGEKLSELIDKYNIRSADVYNKVGMKKSYFSKIKGGLIIPQNCDVVYEIADVIGVTEEEKMQLCDSYAGSKLGKKHMDILKALKKIYHLSNWNNAECPEENEFLLQNGMVIANTENIKSAVKQMMRHSGTLDMILSADDEQICFLLAEELYKNQNIECRCLLYLEDDEFSDFNVKMFSDVLPLIMTEKVVVRYNYADVEALANNSITSQLFITDDSILLTDGNFTTAVYLANEEAVNTYIRIFEENYSKSEIFCRAFSDISDFIEGYPEIYDENDDMNKQDLYVIKNCPCLMIELDSGIVNSHFRNDDIKMEFLKKYMEFMYNYTVYGIKKHNFIFSENGIDQLLNAEEYYEYNKYIDYPVSKEIRRTFFDKLINSEDVLKVTNVNILNGLFPSDARRHSTNIWSGGKFLLITNFDDGYRIVIMKNKKIVSAILKCITDLKKIRYILLKKNTLEIMKNKLDEFAGRVN